MSPWTAINRASNATLGAWFGLLAPLPVPLQALLTAIPVTLVALLAFRYASNQAGIELAKDQVKAHLLEFRLYQDSPGVLLRAQGQVLLNSLAWFGYSLPPLAVMLVPVALVLVQAESRWALAPLPVGGSALVVATPSPGILPTGLDLAATPGLVAETPRLATTRPAEALWRVGATAPGTHSVSVGTGAGLSAALTLKVAAPAGEPGTRAAGPLDAVAYRADDWRSLGSPGLAPLDPAAGVESLAVDYPRARGNFLGLSSASWMLFGASLALGLLFRRSLGVTF